MTSVSRGTRPATSCRSESSAFAAGRTSSFNPATSRIWSRSSSESDALERITLQRFGTVVRKWLAWWKTNRGRGRAEWLFSGLTSADREMRVAADAELREMADAPIEYSPDMPPRDRERAARALAVWWARSGRVL